MATCIHCGKSGKKICDTCLEKAKKGKLTFLFPLKNNERTTITDACKPKLLPAKVVVSPQTPQPSGTNVEKAVPKEIVVKEEPKSTEQVKNTSTAVAPVAKKITIEELVNSVNKKRDENQPTTTVQNATNSTNATQQVTTAATTTTETTNKYGLDDDGEYMSDDVTTTSSSGSWGWWLALCVLAGIVLTCFLVPWNVGQWIGGITAGLLLLFGFLIGAFVDDGFIAHDVLLYICTAINIGLTVWLKSNYSIISLVISIVLAISSLIVMGRAYYEFETKQGHWAMFCVAVNIGVIFFDKIYGYIMQLLSMF